MASFEIPLSGSPETFSINLNGTPYRLTTRYCDAQNGGWFLDIADSAGNPIVSGISLVTGVNVLGQYGYADIAAGAALYVVNVAGGDAAPTFDNLGTDVRLVLATF